MRRNLIEARKSKGLTQKALADLVGVSPAAIGHLERNRNDARRVTWRKLANIFKSSIEHLSLDEAAVESFNQAL